MNILVTGGCGFIGGHTVDALVNAGHDVVVVDDLSAPENDYFHFNETAAYYAFDISSPGCFDVFDTFDVIYHFAARSRIQPTFDNKAGTTQVNTIGTQNVLDLALKNKDCKVIYAGTSSLYGHENPVPFREDMEPELNTPYSLSKWFGERLCEFYSRTYGVQTIVLRYFNVYGPREPTKGHYAPVIGLLKRQFASGKKMTVVGSGNQRRDFTHINDVVTANVAAMGQEFFPINSQYNFEIYNVGTGENYSINEITQMIMSPKTKLSKAVLNIPLRKSEIFETQADITKISECGWSPSHKLPDMINSY